MQALAVEDGLDIIKNAMDAAAGKFGISHFGINGFCMGGTYTLHAACELEGFSARGGVLRRHSGRRCFEEADDAYHICLRNKGQVDKRRKGRLS